MKQGDQSGQLSSTVMLGWQATGKTSYLTALYGVCLNERDGASIAQYASSQDRGYLNRRLDEQRNFRSHERTGLNEAGQLNLPVRLSAEDEVVELRLPDLSGEAVRDALNDRYWDDGLAEALQQASSIMLFLNSANVRRAESLASFQADAASIGISGEGTTAPEPEQGSWQMEQAPTQVRVTDLMQEVQQLREGRPLRLTVLLSAWDKQPGGLTPEAWISEELPLVVQLLDGAPEIEWAAFGASAQGGDYSDAHELERLEGLEHSERAAVWDAAGQRVSVTEPVRWSLGMSG